MADPVPTSPLARTAAVIAVVLLVGVLLAAEFAYRPPAPRRADAPATEFSAQRAHALLARVLDDQAPHPLGSEANAAVRDRLLGELSDLGLEPIVQTALVSYRGAVARVHNVLARIDGREPGAVLLAAHHDSVAAGPGASDDGAGVAAMLETARALLQGPPPLHPIILLIDDGEELGLYGARAFGTHPWAKEVAVVLNFEARGTCGASLLFETAGPDLWTLQQAATHVTRPITGSAFAAVYRTLPNGTDLSVFDRLGMRGLNFAFVGGARRYHTPLDDLAHLDLGSLQHHGDNMLQLARGLAEAPDLTGAHTEHAVFFDLLARKVVVLARDVELPASGSLLLGWVLLCLVQRGRGKLRPRALGLGLLAPLAGLGTAAALGLGLSLALGALGRLPTPFPPYPAAYELCYALAGTAAALASLALGRRRLDTWHRLAGTGVCLSLLAITVAVLLPGSSYPLFVLAAGTLVVAALPVRATAAVAVATWLAAAADALVLAPFVVLLPSAIGLAAGPVHAAAACLGVLALGWVWPALLGRRLVDAAIVTGLASACAIGLLVLTPAHDRDHPARANLVHVSLTGKPPVWFLDDADLRADRTFRGQPLPWERIGWCAPAEASDAPAPRVEWRREARGGDRFVLRGSMRSRRDAPWLVLTLPPELRIEAATVAGVKVDLAPRSGRPTPGQTKGWHAVAFLGAEPDEDIPFEIVYRGRSRSAPYVYDRRLGLPADVPSGRALVKARAAAMATAIHLGDGSIAASPLAGW